MNGFYDRSIETFLRPPPNGFSRSAYATEVNPWATKGDIEAALFYRGVIVSSIGSIETQLGEISIRFSRVEDYASLRERFPYKFNNRISYLKDVFSHRSLAHYKTLASQFFDRVEWFFEIRHMVAHARMEIMPNWGVTFHHFTESGPVGATIVQKRLTLEELDNLAWRSAKLSRLAQSLVNRLNQETVLKNISI